LIVAGGYGARPACPDFDPFLKARYRQALTITALGCHVRGMKGLRLVAGDGAVFIHR